MRRGRFVFMVAIAAALVLPSSNFPARESNQQTQTNDLIVTVQMATEVRSGLGQVYDLVAVINPGQQVEALGLSPSGDYLLIKDPSKQGVLGWLTSASITAAGDPVGLPISTPPPTPPAVTGHGDAGNCPTPVGGGPTPVGCVTPVGVSSSGAGCPTPIGGGPTPVSCSLPAGPLLPVRRATALPTVVLVPVPRATVVPTVVR